MNFHKFLKNKKNHSYKLVPQFPDAGPDNRAGNRAVGLCPHSGKSQRGQSGLESQKPPHLCGWRQRSPRPSRIISPRHLKHPARNCNHLENSPSMLPGDWNSGYAGSSAVILGMRISVKAFPAIDATWHPKLNPITCKLCTGISPLWWNNLIKFFKSLPTSLTFWAAVLYQGNEVKLLQSSKITL